MPHSIGLNSRLIKMCSLVSLFSRVFFSIVMRYLMNVMCNVNKISFFPLRDMSYELCSTFVNVFAFCVNVYIFQIEMSIGRNEGDITRDVMMLISSISLYKLTLYCRIIVWMPYRSTKKSEMYWFITVCLYMRNIVKGMHMCTFCTYNDEYKWNWV